MKYFVVYRYRNYFIFFSVSKNINTNFVRHFHAAFEKAYQELHEGFYDDCDYDVFSIDEKNIIKRQKR